MMSQMNPTTAERIDELIQTIVAIDERYFDAALDSLPEDSDYFSPNEDLQAAWCSSPLGTAFAAELERQLDEARHSLSAL
jgi:hypothetical protein